MIVSHQHQYIYFAVPKTATHSIREILRASMGALDWEQQTLRGKQYLPIKELAEIGHGHIDVTQAHEHLAPEIWDKYQRIAFVRNPFDRFVSACAFMTRGAVEFTQEPRQWMKNALHHEQFRKRVLIRPQTEQLCNSNGELDVHHVGRYENLHSSFNHILSLLGLPQASLARRNPSNHAAWQDYYDSELKAMVEKFYAKDLSLFEYTFDRD